MQNTRRRAEDEISKARKFAIESFAESLLPVVDSLEAGLATRTPRRSRCAKARRPRCASSRARWSATRWSRSTPAVGAKFDPHQHQAISVVPLPPDSTQEANTVVSVLQKGYLIADRVLRPALVTVAAAK